MKHNTLNLFLKLVQIDSPSGEEKEIGKFVMGWLEETGFKYKQDKVGNILGLKEKYEAQPVLFCAHMDTVEPGRGIKPLIKNGFVCSNGDTILGADNKASLAAIMVAIGDYKIEWRKLPDVELLFTVKEETGGGVEFFNFDWLKSKTGYIFDYAKPLGTIIVSSPFIYNFRIKFIGKAAHSSRPEDGVNSLIPAIKFIGRAPLGKFDNGETTINIGRVSSGKGINIIPPETSVEGEVRCLDKNLFDTHLGKIKNCALSFSDEKLKVEFSLDGFCPGYKYEESGPLIMKAAEMLKRMGYEAELEKSTGVSDANSLIDAGLQVLTLSDGVEMPHTKEERIKIDDLNHLTEIVSNLMAVPQ